MNRNNLTMKIPLEKLVLVKFVQELHVQGLDASLPSFASPYRYRVGQS